MPTDARTFLPLKPLVYEVLLALTEGERHGWSLVREVQDRTGAPRIMPANFYRTLRGMLADGLIEEVDRPRYHRETAPERRGAAGSSRATAPGGAQGSPPVQVERRRYFRISPLGRAAAQLEARRLAELVGDARARRLLKTRS